MTEIIGKALPRPDALEKVTGQARYPADLVQPHMLQIQVVFARRPHARILAIETEKALQIPGVVAVLTAQDVPFNRLGPILPDQPVLCGEKVRFEGDRVALVLAENKRAAKEGARQIHVLYEDLPAVTDPREALCEGAPLVHEQHGSNCLLHLPLCKGDPVRALQEADVIVEGEFRTGWQEHAFLQTEAGISYIDERGRVVVETAGQWLYEDRRQIARMLQLPEEQVIVRYAAVGGAFGGRDDVYVQPLLALAAWKMRRPVALVWSREESFIGHHKRHPTTIRCRWGARRNGLITAVEAEILADGGAYASTSTEILKVMALLTSGCYEVPHIKIDGYVAYTNNGVSGAFRGFGAPQIHFATECIVTRLAQKLGLDPVEFRRRNMIREGSTELAHAPLPPGVSASAVLEKCAEEVQKRWHREDQQPNEEVRRGIGLACGVKCMGYSFGFPEQATATVAVFGTAEPERAEVRIGAADVGQGAHLTLQQIAAETLQLPLERVSLVCHESGTVPDAGCTAASRITLVAGRAVKEAARVAREKWSDTDQESAKATVQYQPPTTIPLEPVPQRGQLGFCYAYAAQAVEVEVHRETGVVHVRRVISVHDVGKAINTQQITGQVEGGVAQAIGYALLEDFPFKEGRALVRQFGEYALPTAADMPDEIVSVLLEQADPNGPYGARGMAEMPLVPFASAVAIAIQQATGVWITQLPMLPERVLAAIQENASTSSAMQND